MHKLGLLLGVGCLDGEGTVLDRIKQDGIRWIDLHFVDFTGGLQHITIPAHHMGEKELKYGIGKLDGSSIKGFKPIFESDMILMPDQSTYAIIPWETSTCRIYCDIYESGGVDKFSRDSRHVARKAEMEMKKQGFDVSYWGPEPEFFVFDSVKYDTSTPFKGQSYSIESSEGAWASAGTNYPIRFKEGYYPAPPVDSLQELRRQTCTVMEDAFGIEIDAHHHEVATAGQVEIDMKYAPLVQMADNLVTYKFVAKNVGKQHGKMVTFIPKPIFGDNASGMHVHQSLWAGGKNKFYDPADSYAEVSQACRYYIGGLLEHGRALSAIVSPTTNSYKRLVPGYEAPVYLAWSRKNRSAAVRIPMYHGGEGAKRIEYRPPDPSCNPYLAFAAMSAAGLDGIKRKLEPGNSVDQNIYHLSPQQRKELGIRELPGSLEEALNALESDCSFLEPIFSRDAIEMHLELKREEHKQNSIRPTPYEFQLYLDV